MLLVLSLRILFVLLQREKKKWSSDVNSWLIGKVPGAEIDWEQKEKRASEDEKLDGITDAMDMTLGKLQETVRDRGLGWYSPWSCRVGHNWVTEKKQQLRNFCLTLGSKLFFYFFLNNFVLHFKDYNSFWVNFCIEYKVWIEFNLFFLLIGQSITPVPYVEKATLLTLNCFSAPLPQFS